MSGESRRTEFDSRVLGYVLHLHAVALLLFPTHRAAADGWSMCKIRVLRCSLRVVVSNGRDQKAARLMCDLSRYVSSCRYMMNVDFAVDPIVPLRTLGGLIFGRTPSLSPHALPGRHLHLHLHLHISFNTTTCVPDGEKYEPAPISRATPAPAAMSTQLSGDLVWDKSSTRR